MTDAAHHIVPRMRDTLERLIAWLETRESESRGLLDALQNNAEADDELISSMEAFSAKGAEAERTLFEEYLILRSEWDAQKESLPGADRDAMNELGERVNALSFATHDLYNQIAGRVATLAERDRDESGRLHQAASALRRYRPDGGEDNRGFSIRA